MPVSTVDYLVSFVGLAVLVVFLQKRRNPSGLPYPPGPKGLPLLGNIFDIPKQSPWKVYAQWAKQYGDIISVQAMGQTIVIINSAKIARDLLGERGAIYSDRPTVPAFELMKFDYNLVFTRYRSPKWKLGRKLADHSLRSGAALAYRPMQTRKVNQLLKKLPHTQNIIDDIRHMTAGIIMSLTYGYEIAESKDKFVYEIEDLVQRASAVAVPGATMINVFPPLRYLPAWFPGMDFKRDALSRMDQMAYVLNAPYNFTMGEIHKGIAQPSIIMDTLKSFSDKDLTEAEERSLKEVAATIYIAGTDTSVSLLSSFFIALIEYPDVQKRAQGEIDAIIGRNRLPNPEDRQQLPYINAICMELKRWKMVTPLGVVRETTEDDVYEGYFVPKGSQVLVNAWSMLHDPIAYPDPEAFRPERFLAPDGTLIEDPLLTSAFGWGRRLCPGRFLADSTAWAVVASVLSAFNVSKAKDAEGREISVDTEFTDHGAACQPRPFKCSIVPRDVRAEEIIAGITTATA